ncbi:amidohydrolase [Cereibacter sphaeroides]|uniref:amidohydrolase n=1 Tax=Cereibacter sphaeroides TaxID=1063 RepID=UPI001F45C087|nr:amidohydrolase family protein [Cereibacter sphaeroides]MCE6967432.1 amidohydrolase [Cereibacter sphaeroides]
MNGINVTRRRALGLLGSVSAAAIAGGALAQGLSLQDVGRDLGLLPTVTVYTARRVITMEGNEPEIDAVAVVGDRVLAAGPRAAIEARLGNQPHVIDDRFEGKVIIAGLIDQHVHPVLAALTMTAKVIAIEDWDLPTGFSPAARTPEDYIARLTAAEEAMTDPETPLLTWGYHHYFHGLVRRPDLDAISATRPIIVWHRSAHEFVMNTPALELVGVTEAFVDGLQGTPREQSDFAAGHFYEQGAFAIMPLIAPVLATPERLMTGLALARDYAHRAGVTLMCEPGGVLSRPLQDAQNTVLSGEDAPMRTFYMADGKSLAALHLKDGRLIEETEALLDWGTGKTAFLPRQVKLFADGAIYSQLMQVTVPYTDGHAGEWIMDPDFFNPSFDAYWAAGYQIHIHQNGDLGLDIVLDAVERNMRRTPRADHRTVIVHFGYARADQCDRLAALGCIVSANPYYVTALADRYGEIGLGPERADGLVPVGFVRDNGTPISFHSDMPMAPGQPLFLVWAGVNRTTVSGRVAGPEHRLTVEEALRAVTIDAAQSLRLDVERGSIAPGKYATFTILEDDPFGVPPEAIRDIKVWGTVLEGRVFPVPKAAKIDETRLFAPKGTARQAPLYALASVVPVAMRGGFGGCGCCASPSDASCAAPGRVAGAMGCCSTNALGWAVAAEWAARV